MTNPIQLVIVKRRAADANAEKNSKHQTVCHVQSVTSAIRIVDHVSVILMVRMAISVNHRTANAHANRTLPAIFVNAVPKDFTVLNVCRVIVIEPVHLIILAM